MSAARPDPAAPDDAAPNDADTQAADPILAALRQQIAQLGAQDPHIAARIASRALLEQLFAILTSAQGRVHMESACAALGALAGHACQQSALIALAGQAQIPEGELLMVTDAQGENYYYGHALNAPLLEDAHSLRALLGGCLQALGAPLPEAKELVLHVTQTLGTPAFGQPRLPEGVTLQASPRECLPLWPALRRGILDALPVPPAQWPLAFGLALQELITQGKDALAPTLAAQIALESAIAMSKVIVHPKSPQAQPTMQ